VEELIRKPYVKEVNPFLSISNSRSLFSTLRKTGRER